MTDTQVESKQRCPRCGGELTTDQRFVVWCTGCEWNIDPSPAPQKQSRRERLGAGIAERSAASVFEQVSKHPDLRPKWDLPRVAAYAVAIAVHLLTVAVFAAGVVVIALSKGSPIGIVLGLALIAYAILLRPRLKRPPAVRGKRRARNTLLRSDAPNLFALVDEVGDALGAPRVDAIRLDPGYRASYAAYGLRRRRVLTIGIQQWSLLDPQMRVAHLGHEQAHSLNGDLRHTIIVGTAVSSLVRWYSMLRLQPARARSRRLNMGFPLVAEKAVRLLMRPLAVLVGWTCNFELSLLFRSTQRAEYLADELSARVAGVDAVCAWLSTHQIAPACIRAIVRHARQPEPLWDAHRRFAAGIPATERLRLERLDERRPHSLYVSHPHNAERIAFVRSLPAAPPQMTLTLARSKEIDLELSRWFKDAETTLRERYL